MKYWTAEDIIEGIEHVDLAQVDVLADKLGAILAGKHPGVQSCALAEALAIWLLGHDAKVRETLLTQHIATVRGLIEGRK